MALPNKDEIKGKFDELKGKVKEGAGKAMNDPDMVDEGRADQVKGKVQNTFGEGRRKVGEAIEDLGKKVRE